MPHKPVYYLRVPEVTAYALPHGSHYGGSTYTGLDVHSVDSWAVTLFALAVNFCHLDRPCLGESGQPPTFRPILSLCQDMCGRGAPARRKVTPIH